MIFGLLLGAGAALFWSLTNIIDKYLTAKHASDGNVWGILILSCLFPAILLPAALQFESVQLPIREAIILMTAGGLMVVWIYCYLKALIEDDTSIVMTLLVLAPFFSLLFGNIVLGEMLTFFQLTGGALLVFGSLVVCYSPQGGGFKWKLLSYALAASIIMGLMHTMFKFATVEEIFWRSIFWRSLGMVLIGFLLCLIFSKIRNSFIDFLTGYFRKGLSLNSANESFTLLGDTLFGFAILLAPIALVQTTEAYQPIFIILITTILTKFGFDFAIEDNTYFAMTKKIIGIGLVFSGSVILVLNS